MDRAPRIAILGAGFSGLCMAMSLVRAGIRTFTIYEKGDGVGGTWRDNTYPGAGCDVPSHLYSYSFAPKADWTRKFSEQPEILAYLEECARAYDLHRHIRFGTALAAARFDEAEGAWRLRTDAGEELSAEVLVCGAGQLSRPRYPSISGLDQFAGAAFHSARWDHACDLRGKRVAVIGNGASAIQIIPRVAPEAGRLHAFQRSAAWVIPRKDRAYSRFTKWAFAHVPLARRLYRAWLYWALEKNFFAFRRGSWLGKLSTFFARRHLKAQIADPALREALLPDFPIGCKRVLISDDYYPALARENVEVVTAPIERVTADAIVTGDGQVRPVDAIVLATGFETTSLLAPLRVEGLGGVALEDAWAGGAEAHLGVTVAGFPNLLLLYGPNTNLGHNSIIFMIECQVRYAMRWLRALVERDLRYLDVEPARMARFNADLQRDLERSVWAADCGSWYKNEAGKIVNNWSTFTAAYWWRTRRFRLDDYVQAPRDRTA
jgi:cation diffusion facilitator CzcD-associated flavoprotein CzcO